MRQGKKLVGNKRWWYLTVCAIGLLFTGIIYAWSILKVPLAEEFAWSAPAMAVNYTLMTCFFCAGSVISGILSKRISFRCLLFGAGILIFASYGLMARLPAGSNVGWLYLFYGGFFGTGVGLAYNTLLSIGNAWFPDKRGTSSGFMMMFYGFSTMCLGKLASQMFTMEQFGWRMTYELLGAAVLLVMVFCVFCLKEPSATIVFPKATGGKRQNEENFEPRDYSTAETIRRPAFWLFYIYGTLAASVGSAVISFAHELSLTLGAHAALATTLVGVLSVCNGLGRVFSGLCYDWLGRRRTMLLVSMVTLIAPILVLVALQQGSLVTGTVSLCLTGISFGCCPTISSAFISSFYGTKDFSLNYSIGNTKMLISSFAATAASSLLAATGSYTAPFIMLTIFAVLSLVLNFSIKKP